MSRYYTIEAKTFSNDPETIYIKNQFNETTPITNDTIIEFAEKQGIDFSSYKTFNNPVEVTEAYFNYATDFQGSKSKKYVAWSDENGFYEPKKK